jgi:hypothetical protein
MTRGRQPPVHEPLVCGCCLALPQVRNGVVDLKRCRCGAKWHIELMKRPPEWVKEIV